MNVKYSGLIFVLIVLVDAISGLRANTINASHSLDLPAVIAVPEKSTAENGTAKLINIIKPNSSDVNLNEKSDAQEDIKKKNTTTTTTTSTTSTTPTTTTIVPPPTPTPAPAPEKGTWIVRNETTKTTCIIAKMAMQLNITYPGEKKPLENAILYVPKNATANGSCDESSQSLNITWGPGHSLTINFKENKTTKNFFVSGFDLNVIATFLKDAKVENNGTTWHFSNKSSEFVTPLQMSYKCSQEQDLKLNGDNANLTAVVTLKDTQLEAYMNKTKAEFGTAQDCDSFDTPDIVPIAVGCALTVLVLVVLAAYLIGRRRSQNRGYLSM